MSTGYDIFISYRRESGAAEARLIRFALIEKGKRTFLDVTDLHSGFFDEALLSYIAATPHFILILSPGALERCAMEDDWLRREIAHALQSGSNIIPVFLPGFKFPTQLPEDLRNLPRHQGVDYSHRYFEAMIEEIVKVCGPVPSGQPLQQRFKQPLKQPAKQPKMPSGWEPPPVLKETVVKEPAVDEPIVTKPVVMHPSGPDAVPPAIASPSLSRGASPQLSTPIPSSQTLGRWIGVSAILVLLIFGGLYFTGRLSKNSPARSVETRTADDRSRLPSSPSSSTTEALRPIPSPSDTTSTRPGLFIPSAPPKSSPSSDATSTPPVSSPSDPPLPVHRGFAPGEHFAPVPLSLPPKAETSPAASTPSKSSSVETFPPFVPSTPPKASTSAAVSTPHYEYDGLEPSASKAVQVIRSPMLLGTKWEIDGNPYTIEFLADGVMSLRDDTIVDRVPAQSWKQTGDHVTIRLPFVSYEMTLSGDVMSGTQQVLQNPEKKPAKGKRVR